MLANWLILTALLGGSGALFGMAAGGAIALLVPWPRAALAAVLAFALLASGYLGFFDWVASTDINNDGAPGTIALLWYPLANALTTGLGLAVAIRLRRGPRRAVSPRIRPILE